MKIFKFILAVAFIFLMNDISFAQDLDVGKGAYIQKIYISANNKVLESSGDFIISKSIGIYWATKKPLVSETIMTKNKVVQISKNGEKKVLDNNDTAYFNTIAKIMKSIFTLDKKKMDKFFNEEKLSESTYSYKPKDKILRDTLDSVYIALTDKNQIKSLTLHYANNDKVEYILNFDKFEESLSAEDKVHFEK